MAPLPRRVWGRSRGRARVLVTLVAAATIAAVATSTGAGVSAAAPSGYTLNVGFISQGKLWDGPEGFAYSKGLFLKWLKPAGVTAVKGAAFQNGPLLIAALVGGSVDVGNLGDTPALIAKSQGVPVAMINQDEVGNPAWIVGAKGITSLSQLAGKSVGRPQGSYIDRYLQGLLAQKGLLAKVHLVSMLTPQAIAAVESGSIQAVALPAYSLVNVVKKAGLNVLAKSETTPKLEGTSVTIGTKKVLAAHPNLATVWNDARKKSIAYAKSHAGAFYAYQGKVDGITAAEAREFLPISEDPVPDYTKAGLNQLQGTLNFLVSIHEAKPFSLTSWEEPGT